MIDEQKQKFKPIGSDTAANHIDHSLTNEPYCSNTARGIDRRTPQALTGMNALSFHYASILYSLSIYSLMATLPIPGLTNYVLPKQLGSNNQARFVPHSTSQTKAIAPSFSRDFRRKAVNAPWRTYFIHHHSLFSARPPIIPSPSL
jgi:hypothetical protein